MGRQPEADDLSGIGRLSRSFLFITLGLDSPPHLPFLWYGHQALMPPKMQTCVLLSAGRLIRIGYSLKATHPSTSKNFTKNTVNTEKLCNFVLTNNSGYFGVITLQML